MPEDDLLPMCTERGRSYVLGSAQGEQKQLCSGRSSVHTVTAGSELALCPIWNGVDLEGSHHV